MKKMIAALGLVPVLAMAQGHTVTVGPAAMTGNDYIRLSQDARTPYVLGVIDGMLYAPVLADSNLAFTNRIDACFEEMKPSNGQFATIVDAYLKAHPPFLGLGMHAIVYRAMVEACAQVGKPLH